MCDGVKDLEYLIQVLCLHTTIKKSFKVTENYILIEKFLITNWSLRYPEK